MHLTALASSCQSPLCSARTCSRGLADVLANSRRSVTRETTACNDEAANFLELRSSAFHNPKSWSSGRFVDSARYLGSSLAIVRVVATGQRYVDGARVLATVRKSNDRAGSRVPPDRM